jgi:WD40 repeat protein
VSFSADGKLIAAASWDKSILVWDRESGAVVKKVENNGWWFSAVSFSSDGKLLVAASYDGTVQVLDPNTGKNILRLHVPKK